MNREFDIERGIEMIPAKERVKNQPDIFLRLAQSSMTVAKHIRNEFLENSFTVADKIRELMEQKQVEIGIRRLLPYKSKIGKITACFIDGGVGDVEIFSTVPLMVRGGIFRVKEGEHDLEKRETFEFFPVLTGDLDGGDKSRSDYSSVVRIIIELGSVLRVLRNEKFADVNLIMLHGPLLYRLSAYSEHWFYESDYLTMLCEEEMGHHMLDSFYEERKKCQVHQCWCTLYRSEKRIKANCIIAHLLNTAIKESQEKDINLVGVTERATATELTSIFLQKALEENPDIAAKYLVNPSGNYKRDTNEIINLTRYTDAQLCAMILDSGEYLSFYDAKERYSGFSGDLKGFEAKLPQIGYTYLKSVENAMPMRVEVP